MTKRLERFPLRCGTAVWPGVLLLAASVAPLSAESSPAGRLVAVRFWSFGDVTRVAIQTDSEIRYKTDRVPNPDRIFFDLHGIKPKQPRRGLQSIVVGDKLLKQIRIAETLPGVTRVVLDVGEGVEYSASQLTVPDRLIIELRVAGKTAAVPPERSVTGNQPIQPEANPEASSRPEPPVEARVTVPRAGAPKAEESKPLAPPKTEGTGGSEILIVANREPASREPAKLKREPVPLAKVEVPSGLPAPAAKPAVAETDPGSAAVAQEDSHGSRSLIRALGLKIGRVVLDPGHGGHDSGTIGPSGLTEKELVLDVARRLGALITQRMGSEVIYTRINDVFVPLEARTEFANEKKADLFLSIHANSSRARSISGPETFYLNFTASAADMEVAAMENATAQRSVSELQELIQRIARKEKVQESREFASSVQGAMYGGLRAKSGGKNRGVKKAPFVVLIGAQMPSVLAEIAFLSNPKEEKLLKRPDYRQRIAESLYKGLAQYANTLSHFQVARRREL